MPGDCHYLEGNHNAKRRIGYLKKLLQEIGLEADRVRMVHISSAMAAGFVEAATEMTELIRRLGPSPMKKKPEQDPSITTP